MHTGVAINQSRIIAFCQKWKIRELSLFGSVIHGDFRPDSDVDVLVSFNPAADWSYWEWPDMQDELKDIFGHEVDLIEAEALKNKYRRAAIMNSREVIYALS